MRVEKASVCPLDCPDTCSLTVAVEDETILEVRGSRANPYTAGVICAKVARDFPAFTNGDDRYPHPAPADRGQGRGALSADLLGRGARRHPRARHRGDRRARSAGGAPAELRGAARDARGRLHGPALLPQARRVAPRQKAAVRRHPRRGVDGDVRRGPRDAAGAGGAVQAGRGLGQQRHVVEPAPDAPHQHRCGAGAASSWWSIPCAPRWPSSRICTWRSGRAPT